MAPTIQDKTRDRRREKHSEQRYVTYTPTCLEENFKFDIITDHDLGVHIDLIDPDTYKKDSNSKLNPDDEKLLLEDDLHLLLNPQSGINDRASRHAKAVPWLRRTEYISTEYNRFSNISDKVESRIGFRIQKLIKEDEDFYKDHESQINAINATFSNVKKKITKHYSKPNVYAIEELPVFPDFQLWKHPCAQVLFDSDPYFNQQNQNLNGQSSQKTPLTQIQKEKLLSQAMIRGMMDDSGNQFVAYFLPTEKTMNKFTKDLESNVDFTPEELYYYQMTREYNWNVKNKLSKGYEENYFFVFREVDDRHLNHFGLDDLDTKKHYIAFYNELETRVRLNKRRLMQGQQSQVNRTKLAVHYRQFNENELYTQETRLRNILTSHAVEEKSTQDDFSQHNPNVDEHEDILKSEDDNPQDTEVLNLIENSNESSEIEQTLNEQPTTYLPKQKINEENEIFGSSSESE